MTRILTVVVLISTVWIATAGVEAQAGAPTGLTAVVTGNSVTLTWQAPAGTVLTYVVEAGSASGLSNLVNVPTWSAATTLAVTSVPVGTYYVRVRAYSSATGLSAPSNEITVVVAPCSLAAPANLTALALRNIVSLAWSGSAGATSYQLEAGSAPTLSNVVSAHLGATLGTQAQAPTGTYYVRVRAHAPSCAPSAPSDETVVRVGVSAGIGFGAVGAHNTPFTSYMENGFTVDALSGSWMVQRNYGAPLPFVQFTRGPSEPTISGQVRVTAGGQAFRFTSVDLYSSVTPIPYVITGLLNATAVFTLGGTVPHTFGAFATVSAATGHLAIDTLLIELTNPTTAVANPVGMDNIAVSFPEQ